MNCNGLEQNVRRIMKSHIVLALSRLSGGTNLTLDPAVAGSYVKPISTISYPRKE